MKKSFKAAIAGILIIAVVVLSVCFLNRFSFGTWNPFELPDRIECFDRRYYNQSTGDIVITGSTLHLINSSDNKTGKALYVKSQAETYSNGPVPTIIYLKTGEDSYHIYVLSGGP